MLQDSTSTSLYRDLFSNENFDDYESISIETIREGASKCKYLLTNTDNDESDKVLMLILPNPVIVTVIKNPQTNLN